jgi:uncharacterized protein YcbK (DUF882 family)
MRLSSNFQRKEFACQCGCNFDTVDAVLLRILTSVRHYFQAPVTITSGCRCEEHNRKEGGPKNSYHLYGKAADIKVEGFSPSEVISYLIKTFPVHLGFIEYSSWVHIDVRSERYVKELS